MRQDGNDTKRVTLETLAADVEGVKEQLSMIIHWLVGDSKRLDALERRQNAN